MPIPTAAPRGRKRLFFIHRTFRVTLLTMLVSFIFLHPYSSHSQIRINELGIAPGVGDAAGGGEFIELYNQGGCVGPVDISCYVILYTGTSGGGNPTGWSITIPAGTILPACSYYLIGGSGQSPNPTWTAIPPGGSPWINSYGANGRAVDLDISTSSNSGLQSLRPGNLVNTKGQVTIYDASGAIVTSVSYNAGHNPASFPGSFSNPSTGCNAISPFTNPGAAANDVTAVFSGAAVQGIYLSAAGSYLPENDLTPGKTNTLNGGTQICCNPTITINPVTPPVCFSPLAQTTTLSYSATTNAPTLYSITWNAAPANSFVTVTNAPLPASPIIINIPAGTPAGVYTGNLTVANAGGCSSCVKTFTVTVQAAGTSTTNVSICASQFPYTWNGNTYNSAGTYNVHITTPSGCDSIATLVLTAGSSVFSSTPVSICPSQLPYTWNGNTYNSAGSYNVTLVSASGCDSIATLVLTVKSNTGSSTPVSVCPAQLPYTWNGNTYNSAGSYNVTLVNAAGCDSVATLVLTVKNNTSSSTPVSVCPAQLPYTWNGNTYNSAGSYNVTLVNAAGCDSVATLVLTVKNNTSSSTPVSVCQAQLPYTWNGNTYNTAGSYNVTLVNAAGCDSVATLVLTVKPNTTSTTTVRVCPAQLPYTWNGNTYNSAGTYTVTLVNAAGCDSVATLVLNTASVTSSLTLVSVCSNQLPYYWNGNTYNTNGNYQVILVNAAGCDSLANLTLSVKNSSSSNTNVSVCPSQLPYIWNGNTFNAAGTYLVHLINAAGCDSAATLVLSTGGSTSSTTTASVCTNQLPFSWNGNLYLAAGNYQVLLTNAAGCDSTAILQLSTFTLAPPPYLGNDTTICPLDKITLNPGVYAQYLWQDQSTNPFFIAGQTGTYSVIVTNAQGCSASASIHINVYSACGDIFFPTAITPNNDGLNDRFGPLGNLNDVKNYILRVYNRNGEIVFSSQDPFQSWNGLFQGTLFANNNFVWQADYTLKDGTHKRKKGNLAVIR